jgi:Zn-dependent oligopeptidase
VPSHRSSARPIPTPTATPGRAGPGRRATDTLFHEGGHAAHFANIVMPAPCFAQEFAPMSVGHAETQSMLLESLLEDPVWQQRHARTSAGAAMSEDLILRGIAVRQPMAAWSLRSMLSVCFAERALYEIPDEQLSASRVLEELRAVERRLVFLEQGSPRPVLSVPHLASNESSAYYHGYVLADMALEQTAQFFRRRDGSLVDNPRVGPDLAEHYWRSGNQLPFRALVEGLTGEDLGAGALATRGSRDPEQAQAEARAVLRDTAPAAPTTWPELEAHIRVVHGREVISEAGDGELERLCGEFESWIEARIRG